MRTWRAGGDARDGKGYSQGHMATIGGRKANNEENDGENDSDCRDHHNEVTAR